MTGTSNVVSFSSRWFDRFLEQEMSEPLTLEKVAAYREFFAPVLAAGRRRREAEQSRLLGGAGLVAQRKEYVSSRG